MSGPQERNFVEAHTRSAWAGGKRRDRPGGGRPVDLRRLVRKAEEQRSKLSYPPRSRSCAALDHTRASTPVTLSHPSLQT